MFCGVQDRWYSGGRVRQGHKLDCQNRLGKRAGPYMVEAITQEGMDVRDILKRKS